MSIYTAKRIREIIEITWVPWAEVKETYGKQVTGYNTKGSTATKEQRDHIYRLAQGLAKHVFDTNPTHAELIAYTIGKSKVKRLFDGYTRMYHWIESDLCPFEELSVKVYHLESKADLDWMYASINSMKAAKDNGDHYSAVMNVAELAGRTSKAYRRAVNARSYLRRIIGLPSVGGINALAEKVAACQGTHMFMDSLFTELEGLRAGAVKKALHAGVAVSMFKVSNTLPEDIRDTEWGVAVSDALKVFAVGSSKWGLSSKLAKDVYGAIVDSEHKVNLAHQVKKMNTEASYDLFIRTLEPKLAALAENLVNSNRPGGNAKKRKGNPVV